MKFILLSAVFATTAVCLERNPCVLYSSLPSGTRTNVCNPSAGGPGGVAWVCNSYIPKTIVGTPCRFSEKRATHYQANIFCC
ncbi:hypothetical protein T440DRAFT_470352 [Plenodomus tracheiphilus IPT5]|uniref:Uncharacterized protein n=1 Tax=Plenodomus tracheiphilus IPT5 TaxID=1408161 RepID=A0A6A7AYP0_9PLEO|nr:hypothetical protein T440DRAFT_470352 [Plenodomus tracheiphilus IPT5]